MLVDYDSGTNIVPQLAESWQSSPDGRRFVFPPPTDVRFSSGREFTSADVKYSLGACSPKIHSQGADLPRGRGAADFAAGKRAR